MFFTTYSAAIIAANGFRYYTPSMSWNSIQDFVKNNIDAFAYFHHGEIIVYENMYDDYDIVQTFLF